MRVALFVPCYVDQLWPEVGLAAADVLEAQGVAVDYPEAQTCCGQPFLTDGYPTEARRLAERFADVFASSEHVPSCHGLRELGLGRPSERPGPGTDADKVALLLRSLAGIELVAPERADECCGFGGTFAVGEPDVSCRMGTDRLRAHEAAGAEVVTSIDASCLLHLRGLAERRGSPLRVMHVAEILAGREPPG
jgi:L-lactate dehydrogenase complex protein LldE